MNSRLSMTLRALGALAAMSLTACAADMSGGTSVAGATEELSAPVLVVASRSWRDAEPDCDDVSFSSSARVALAEGAPGLGVVVDAEGVTCVDTLDALEDAHVPPALETARGELAVVVSLVGPAPFAGDPSPQPSRPHSLNSLHFARARAAMGDPSPQPSEPTPDDLGGQSTRSSTR